MGYNPESYYLEIPKEDRNLTPLWRKGNCVPMMGTCKYCHCSQKHNILSHPKYNSFISYNTLILSVGNKLSALKIHVKCKMFPINIHTAYVDLAGFGQPAQTRGLCCTCEQGWLAVHHATGRTPA